MAGRLTIRPAADVPTAAASIAPLLSAEWITMYPGWTADLAIEEFLATGPAGSPPCTWLALDDSGSALGSISLVAHGELDEEPESSVPGPWLANLFVLPEHRGRGVATALIEHAIAHADALGLRPLWLVTDAAPDLHRRFGWVDVSPVLVNGVPNTLMRLD